MPHRPSQIHQNNDNHRIKAHLSHKHTHQHGIASSQRPHLPPDSNGEESTLLGIPAESLTHITSFLPPTALFALGRTNKQLHEHINDDNTWRRAYVCQFLGISPEDDLRNGAGKEGSGRSLMIRRTESTWKKEFVARWNLRRRYERSRSAPVTHVPVHSAVADMHLMPSNPAAPTVPPGLLVASLQYGVVARSYPVTGRILRGFFDAAGSLNGLGVGNPNAEFSPDVSKCALIADGGTAKILWGLRNGAVAVTVAAKAMDTAKVSGGKWARCHPGQQHEGSVEDAVWAGGSSYYCVTGGADGKVKLWDGKKVTCLWTSERPKVRDPCVKVAIDLAYGVIAGIMHSGEVLVWTGFEQIFGNDDPSTGQTLPVREFRLAAAPRAVTPPAPYEEPPLREITAIHLHCPSKDIISLLTVYNNDTHFYRATLDLSSGNAERAAYGNGITATISALEPVFGPDDTSFIIVGDQLGCITIYHWSDPNPISPITPIRQFEVHGNGAVTAIKWTPAVLVTGSSLGSIAVWDSLNFTQLRSFPSVGLRPTEHAWDPVSKLIVEKDLLVVSVGTKVMSWLGGPVLGSERKGKHLKMSNKTNNGVAKWQRQIELYKDIADSRRELENEQTYTRRTYGREREQMSQLDTLGLSEVEAVEYVLMLSREEEEARRRNSPPREDEGVFIGDFDDIQTPIPAEIPFHMAGPSSSNGRAARADSKSSGSPRSYPRTTPPVSNNKVQVSPRFQPEPMEAGMSISPLSRDISLPGSLSSSSRNGGHTPSPDDPGHFPSMSSTPTTGTSTPVRRSVSGSPESVRSAWSTPLRPSRSEGPPSSPSSSAGSSYRRGVPSGSSSPVRQRVLPSGLSMSLISAGEGTSSQGTASSITAAPLSQVDVDEREAEDLKFAIELSLAEARSRGENV